MDLEALVSYLLALAVPLWLVGEYVAHSWKSVALRRGARAGEQVRDRRPSNGSHAPARRLVDPRGPA